MFGDQNDNAAAQGDGSAPQEDTLNGVAALADNSASSASDAPQSDNSGSDQQPADEPSEDVSTSDSQNNDADSNDSSSPAGADADDLLELKQQALQQLTPLVNHLEQSALEKFRTTMMLIQASDNQGLLREAYEAALKIEDEKVRAQALLDVVNEINYFTQPKD